ncbi:hypothetical protein L1987_45469 [Smallanthus sonchifolius]|uniref:Uncharacterized protein n=1 Tax=Smallanthus sonchifolius TaxID=185202 RepID=A0ACB9FWH1_9ASTR|nr:hypothetical protein L1987_45469 [Smallanthus sonchifolius]
MSDLRTAASRTSNYYAASTRRVPDGNHTVYAIAQCNLNISQSVCQGCLNSRYSSILDSCLPGTTGRSIDNGCFMRYSSTPFFGLNQTTDITPFLGDGDSSKRYIIGGVVGGVCFLLLVLALTLWRFRSKSTSSRLQDKSTGSTELLQGPAKYSYDDIKIATSSFSDEHKLGGGVFGEVYKVPKDEHGELERLDKLVNTYERCIYDYAHVSPRYFLSNLNSTLSSFHEQLTNGSRYAVARTLLNGESVWGLASCRAHVSNANCVACYDYAVAQLRVCGTVNGGRAFYDDCDVR